jgi:hypothetical protein
VKFTVKPYFNDIISLVLLVLMALALVAGQSVATGHEVERASAEPLANTVQERFE